MLVDQTRPRPELAGERGTEGVRPVRTSELLVLAALTAAAALLRFATLHVQSFDGDEATTIGLLHRSFGGMLHQIPISEQTPYLYYMIAWGWARLFGYGEVGVRSLSAVVGTVTIPLSYLAAKTLVSRRAGLLTAALVACNPLVFWYSQEARSYALLVALTTAALWAFGLVLAEPRPRRLALWGMLCALGLATHYFAAFLVVPEAAWLLWRARSTRVMRATIAAVALPTVTALALIPLVIAQRSPKKFPFTQLQSLGSRIVAVPKEMVMGYVLPSYAAWAAVAGGLWLIALWLLVRRSRAVERPGGLRAGLLVAVALAAPVLIALAGLDEILTRNFLAVLVPCLIVVAAGFATYRFGWLLAAALCSLWLGAIALVQSSVEWQRPPWRRVASVLGQPQGPRFIFTFPGPLGTNSLALYLRHGVQGPHVIPVTEIDFVGMLANDSPPYRRLEHALPPAPGFHAVLRKYGPGYVVLRFVRSTPFVATLENGVVLRTRQSESPTQWPFCCQMLVQYPPVGPGTLAP